MPAMFEDKCIHVKSIIRVHLKLSQGLLTYTLQVTGERPLEDVGRVPGVADETLPRHSPQDDWTTLTW